MNSYPNFLETRPPATRNGGDIFWSSLGLLVIVVAFCLWCFGCVGAPHSIDDLATMEQTKYESWRDRVARGAKSISTDLVAAGKQTPESMGKLSDALRLVAVTPPENVALASIVGDGYGSAMTILMGEVQAYIEGVVSDEGGLAVLRLADLMLSVADAIDAGAAAGADPAPSK